ETTPAGDELPPSPDSRRALRRAPDGRPAAGARAPGARSRTTDRSASASGDRTATRRDATPDDRPQRSPRDHGLASRVGRYLPETRVAASATPRPPRSRRLGSDRRRGRRPLD